MKCPKCKGEKGWLEHGYGIFPNYVVCKKCKGTGQVKKTLLQKILKKLIK